MSSKIVKISKHFVLGANKKAELTDRKNNNKIKKAIENTAEEVLQGFLREEHEEYIRVFLPVIKEEVIITKSAIKQD